MCDEWRGNHTAPHPAVRGLIARVPISMSTVGAGGNVGMGMGMGVQAIDIQVDVVPSATALLAEHTNGGSCPMTTTSASWMPAVYG